MGDERIFRADSISTHHALAAQVTNGLSRNRTGGPHEEKGPAFDGAFSLSCFIVARYCDGAVVRGGVIGDGAGAGALREAAGALLAVC
jgi:hypothetical protein